MNEYRHFVWTRRAIHYLFIAIVCAGYCAAGPSWADEVPSVLKSQVLLGNAIALKNGQNYAGSSAFLITSGGKLLAISSRAVLSAGDIKPGVLPSELNNSLKLWAFYIPNTSNFNLHADRLISVTDDPQRQYLVLSISNPDAAAGITSLTPAATLPKRGDIVYMPACPSSDGTCHQQVYKFKLIDYKGNDMLAEPLNPIADMRSFAGAPIVDKDGHVFAIGMGVISTGKWKGNVAFFSLQALDTDMAISSGE